MYVSPNKNFYSDIFLQISGTDTALQHFCLIFVIYLIFFLQQLLPHINCILSMCPSEMMDAGFTLYTF